MQQIVADDRGHLDLFKVAGEILNGPWFAGERDAIRAESEEGRRLLVARVGELVEERDRLDRDLLRAGQDGDALVQARAEGADAERVRVVDQIMEWEFTWPDDMKPTDARCHLLNTLIRYTSELSLGDGRGELS